MKLIIYGLGQVFKRYRDIIPMKQVEAFVDKNAENGSELYGIPIIKPSCLSCYEYDFVVVFSDKYFRQIVRELTCEHNIPREKVVSWRIIPGNITINPIEISKYLLSYITAFHNRSILEIGLKRLFGIISPSNNFLRDSFSIDGVGIADYPYEEAFYDHIWQDWTKLSSKYDLAIVNSEMFSSSIIKKLNSLSVPSIVVIVQYNFAVLEELDNILKTVTKKKTSRTVLSSAIIIEISEEKEEELDCVNYVITHKKYRIDQDELYRGLSVGNNRIEGLLSELDGDSIAQYNDRINETSGLYWMWKNTTCKYIGLSHYRRFFFNNTFQNENNRLNKSKIKEILCDKGYDIILSELKELDWPIYENISKTVGVELNTVAYQLFYEAIKEKQPEYIEAFEYVMKNNRMHICNMFVTSRKIMNEYCNWLFSFYLDVVEKIDVSRGTVYQKRVAGYYSEVLWTVWILLQGYKVYELPLTNVYVDN